MHLADKMGVTPFMGLLLSGRRTLVEWALEKCQHAISYHRLDKAGNSSLSDAAR